MEGEGLTEPEREWVLPDAWRGHTGSSQVFPERAAWLVEWEEKEPSRFFTPLAPGSYSDQSNLPEAAPSGVILFLCTLPPSLSAS